MAEKGLREPIGGFSNLGASVERITKVIRLMAKQLRRYRRMLKHPGPNTYSKAKRRGPMGKGRGR